MNLMMRMGYVPVLNNNNQSEKRLKSLFRLSVKTIEHSNCQPQSPNQKVYYENNKINELLNNFEFDTNCLPHIREEIMKITKDVYDRKGYEASNGLKLILLQYSNRIGTEKFDIGRLNFIKYTVNLQPNTKPIMQKPYDHPPPIQDEINKLTLMFTGIKISKSLIVLKGFAKFKQNQKYIISINFSS